MNADETNRVKAKMLKDESGVGMINATKETYHHLPTRILTAASHFELPMAVISKNCFYNLGHIWSLCRHFRASAHNRDASYD